MSQKVFVDDVEYTITHRADLNKNLVPIPYAVVLGGVNFTGVLYLANPVENSFTDGIWVGAVNGT